MTCTAARRTATRPRLKGRALAGSSGGRRAHAREIVLDLEIGWRVWGWNLESGITRPAPSENITVRVCFVGCVWMGK